jgi:hypothetical protein
MYYPEKSLVPNGCEMESKGTTLESSKSGELMTKANKVLKGKKREKKEESKIEVPLSYLNIKIE